ncbi:uncharacterized protein LOC142483395 [Ascaphus truei]|uniref:uncharacterized protein LOC142483395 n=1 Tax=Ascaphus truei TaxID=8439 RepID=UPI003F5A9DFE
MSYSSNMYGNVDYQPPDWSPEPPLKQRSLSEHSDIYLQEESIYEPVTGSQRAERRLRWRRAPPIRGWHWRRNTLLTALAISLALILGLLVVGLTKYSAMATEIEVLKEEQQRAVALGSFLIYNEAHNKCADVRSSSSGRLEITAATCFPLSFTRLFRWLPGAQLLSVRAGLCLGVFSKPQPNLAIQFLPCGAKALSWRCTNETLLGLHGNELYFNYGNNPGGLVILFAGNGPWSRWRALGSGGMSDLQEGGVCAQACGKT